MKFVLSFAFGLVLLVSLASAQLFAPITIKTYEASFGNSGPPRPFLLQTPAINYDIGGQGVGYNVPSPNCTGATCATGAAAYRVDSVNFATSTFGAGFPYQLGFGFPPNAYNYTIKISATGPYQLTLWTSDTSNGGSWNIFIDNALVTNVPTSNTGDFGVFAPTTSASFNATLGTHVMKIAWGSGDTQFNGAGDLVAWQGSQTAVPNISSVAMSCGSSCSFTGGVAGTVGNAQATMTSGTFSGTWSFRTSGSDNFGTACVDRTVDFTISSVGLVTNNAVANGVYTGVCLVATQAGASGSPFTQAVTITGSSSGGTPPPMAQAAGFTQLAINDDFSTSFYANKANWLDCGGAANPQWWQGYQGVEFSSHIPCAQVGQVPSDPAFPSNGPVLWQHWDSSFWQGTPNTIGNFLESFDVSRNPGVNGATFSFYYIEVVARMSNPQLTVDYNLWSITAQAGGFFEFDGIEVSSASNDAGSFVHNHVGTANVDGATWDNNQCPPGVGCFDPKQYHTYAWRVTSDGSTGSFYCTWIDGIKSGSCITYQATAGQIAGDITEQTGIQLANTDRSASCPGGIASKNCGTNGDLYIKSVKVWTCPAWSRSNPGAHCYSSSPNP